MSSDDRFASLDESQLHKITEAKHSNNTKNATKFTVRTFRSYLTAKNVSLDFENFSKAELDTKLRSFYAELSNADG